MSDSNHHDDDSLSVEQQYHLDAPPEKVWRAISMPALREQWLPELDLASADPLHCVPGEQVRYAMRERQPPYLDSEVTLHIEAAPDDGTLLTITHVVREATHPAANDSHAFVMCAA